MPVDDSVVVVVAVVVDVDVAVDVCVVVVVSVVVVVGLDVRVVVADDVCVDDSVVDTVVVGEVISQSENMPDINALIALLRSPTRSAQSPVTRMFELMSHENLLVKPK